MGGGIYTQRHEYANPLTRVVGGAPLPPNTNYAYNNLHLTGVVFGNNLSHRLYQPPANALSAIPATGWVASTLSNVDVVHPLNNHDINFRVLPTIFPLLKTCWNIYTNQPHTYMAGAEFRLFVFNGPGAPGANLLVLPGVNVGPGNGQWSPVAVAPGVYHRTSSANPLQPMNFPMHSGRHYQLVETVTPTGYAAPFGQWRIQVVPDGSIPPILGLAVVPAGYGEWGINMPEIVRDNPTVVRYYVGNRRDFNLPMAGGHGAGLFIWSGGAMVTTGLLAAAFIVVKRRRETA